WTQNVLGTMLVNSADGATIRGAAIAGDLIIAPGVKGKVTLTGVTLRGRVRNLGSATVVHRAAPKSEEGKAEESAPSIRPEEIYTPGTTTGETLFFEGRTIPIYRERERNPFSKDDFYWENGRVVYAGEEFDTQYGVDVSSHQGRIDWEAVASDGIDFAMIRVGYRGYGASGTLNRDKRYEENLRGARAAGLRTGVYFFAQAITVEEAIEEAEFVLDLLRGFSIDGPVSYDWEMHDATYRVYGTPPAMATACAVAFCERIAEAGYTPMIYAGNYVTYVKYDQGAVSKYLSWYPSYKKETSASLVPPLVYRMDYWQYSDSGIVRGIEGRADMNLRFIRK
ncbi:MAG: glycoside hydrolase family 25 protein, partial [Oscillibacter sp.]|nr:glycoside hydrolase family 25 protein [Oscillibacter sp.]